MAQSRQKTIRGVDVGNIKNRNEKIVIKLIPEILDTYYGDYTFDSLDIEDIYALTLNLLPARYTQTGTIVLTDQISSYEIKNRIRDAIERVLENPTRT